MMMMNLKQVYKIFKHYKLIGIVYIKHVLFVSSLLTIDNSVEMDLSEM
jgi:hypothetical protein